MIGIEKISTGEFLDLFPDTKIDLELNNPIFADDDIIPGSFTFPFRVPGSEKSFNNAKLLGNPDVPSARSTFDPYGWRMWLDGVPWFVGKLKIESANASEINIKMNFGLTTVSDDIKTKRIRDIVDEVIVMASNSFTKRVKFKLNKLLISTGVTISYPNLSSFPVTGVVGTYYFEESGRTTWLWNGFQYKGPLTSPATINVNGLAFEFEGFGSSGPIINGIEHPLGSTQDAVNQAIAEKINSSITEPLVTASYSAGFVTVQPTNDADKVETPLVIKVDGDSGRWVIDADDFEAEYNADVLSWLNTNFYTSNPVSEPAKRVRFSMVRNDLYEAGLVNYNAVNFVKSSAGYVLNKPIAYALEPRNETSLCPFVRWRWVLDKVLIALGLQGEGDFLLYNHPEFDKALWMHSRPLDISVEFAGETPWVATARSFNIKDFVTDWAVPEFLKALQKRFNLAVYHNPRTGNLRLQPRENILRWRFFANANNGAGGITILNPDRDITNQVASIGDVDNFEPAGIRIAAARDTKNELSIDDFFVSGDAETQIVSEISGWYQQVNYRVTSNTFYNVVQASRKRDENIPAVMAFYKWRSTTGGSTFNFPSADKDPADCTLKMDGATGFAKVRCPKYIQFLLNRRRVAIELNWSMGELTLLNWEEKLRVFDTVYLLDKLQVSIEMNGHTTVKGSAWTVGTGAAI